MKLHRAKYRNQRTEYNGRVYASKAEAEYAAVLDREKAALSIRHILPQPKLKLGGIGYTPDFRVEYADGRVVFIDVKGFETQAFKIKKRLWAIHGPAPLLLVRKSGKGFKVTETIVPK